MEKLIYKLVAFYLIFCLILLFTNNIDAQVTTVDINHDSFGNGGSITLFDESGNETFDLEPDNIGSGGFFGVRNGFGVESFVVNGSFNSFNNNSVISITGNSFTTFNTSNVGNSSVTLPIDAVSASETIDEVGLTNSTDNLHIFTNSYSAITSQTITAPAPGFILALGTAELRMDHTNGLLQRGDLGVSDTPTDLSNDLDVGFEMPSSVNSGIYNQVSSVHGIFEAVEGVNTFYLVGREAIGDGITSFNNQLTLIYIPSSYGTVTTGFNGNSEDDDNRSIESDNVTKKELSAIQEASIKANQDRMQKEIEELKEILKNIDTINSPE